MKSFQQISSTVVPLDLKDVDTDMIIPAQYLTSTSSGGYGEHLFQRLRDQDSSFPLNKDEYRGAQILVAQENFGCGSSREHAVWALLEYGFRVVIAPSFADIFFSNSGKNGLVLVTLPQDRIQELIKAVQTDPHQKVSVDLEKQLVKLSDESELSFDFDPFRKECILQGHDDFDYLMQHLEDIKPWQDARSKNLFASTTSPNNPLPL